LNSYLTKPERTAVDKSPTARHVALTSLANSMTTAERSTADAGDAEGRCSDLCMRPPLTDRFHTERAHDRPHPPTGMDPETCTLHHPATSYGRFIQGALTRVTLGSIAECLHVYLRFGKPLARRRINARCHAAFFVPGSVFCRIWWEGNAYGTTVWQLSILQAEAPRKLVQRVFGVVPGAAVLLHVQGNRNVQRVLEVIHTIGAQQIELTDVALSFWRMVQNRLAARAELGPFDAGRHAVTLLRRSIE